MEWIIPAVVIAAVVLVGVRALRKSRQRPTGAGTAGTDYSSGSGDERIIP